MFYKSRLTLATALAAVTLAAPPAVAMPDVDGKYGKAADPRQQDMHASTVRRPDRQQDRGIRDGRGEHAASLSDTPPASDLRSADARDRSVQPVVVEVGDPVAAGFDWTAAIIGLGAGLALAVLAGLGVTGGRRRHAGPSTV